MWTQPVTVTVWRAWFSSGKSKKYFVGFEVLTVMFVMLYSEDRTLSEMLRSAAHPVPSRRLFPWEHKGLNTKLTNRLPLLSMLKMWLKLWTGEHLHVYRLQKTYYFNNCFTRMKQCLLLRGKSVKRLCFTANCLIKYFLLWGFKRVSGFSCSISRNRASCRSFKIWW